MWPFKNRQEDQELIEELENDLEKKGFKKDQIKEIMSVFTVSGLYKEGKTGAIKEYEGPIVFYLRNDGKVDIIEDVQAGILEHKIANYENRHALEPRKTFEFPSPNKDNILRGWVVSEDEAMAYPIEPVQDAVQFDNILKQVEGLMDLRESIKGGWPSWLSVKNIIIGIVVIGIVATLVTTIGPQYFPQYFGSHATTTTTTIINATQTGPIQGGIPINP